MRIDRRLTIIGVMLVVLSMTMATQYVTTEIGYTYGIVHPSNADIRFVGFDNSTDQIRIIRTASGTNTSGQLDLTLRFGNVSEKQNLTYTAAFGIVNEEKFQVNITHVYVKEGAFTDYMEIWLHSQPELLATSEDADERAHIWGGGGPMGFSNTTNVWRLAVGNENPNDLNSTNTETEWDNQAYVRFTNDSGAFAKNGTSDFVWVQISINVPDGATIASVTGSIIFYFEASTETINGDD